MPIRATERTAAIGVALARRLRQARDDRSLTQTELAERAGCTKTQIVNLEAGTGGGARLDTIQAIAEALGVAAGWLAFGG